MAQTAKRATIAVYDGQVVISDIVKRKTTVPIFSSNETYSATLVTSWYDGSPMDDTKADGSVYFKLKALPQGADLDIYGQYVGSYFRVNLPKFGETFLEKDTMQAMRDLSLVEVLLLKMGYYKGIKLNGYYTKNDTPSTIEYYLSNTADIDNGGSVIVVGDIKLEHKFKGTVIAEYFGCSIDIEDNKQYIESVIDFSTDNDLIVKFANEGDYKYSTLKTFTKVIKLRGVSEKTVLQRMDNAVDNTAFYINAFYSGTGNDPFLNNCMFQSITFSGNANTERIFHAHGLARSYFDNVWVKNGNTTKGIGMDFQGVQLSNIRNSGCSDHKTPMTSIVYEGLRLRAGTRAGISIGNASNNKFDQTYWEKLKIGIRIAEGDQNKFSGGSPEGCSVYGLLIGNNSRYNRFTGVGFENLGAVDVSDGGILTHYSNCYFSSNFRIGATGRGIRVEDSYGERFEVQSGARGNYLDNIVYNNWGTGSGGIFDSGTNTYKNNIYNKLTNTYDKNNLIKDGYILADSYKVKTHNNINTPVNSVDTVGAFSPIIISQTTEGFPLAGVGLAVDRTGEFSSGNSIGSFKLYSRSDSGEALFLSKKISNVGNASDWTAWRKLIHNNDLATLSVVGLVKQAPAQVNIPQADLVAISTADGSDATTTQDLANAIKAYINANVVPLVNAIKASQNTELTNQRTAGQQAP